MKLTLRELVSSVGEAVQQARHAVEEGAARLFLDQFEPEGDPPVYAPRTLRLRMPEAARPGADCRELEVPVAALLDHRAMRLEEVNLRIFLTPCQQGGELAFQVGGDPRGRRTSELNLTFKSGDMPEGTARLHQRAVQSL